MTLFQKAALIFSLALFSSLLLCAQVEEHSVYYSDEFYARPESDPGPDLKARYQTTDGKMTGPFTSYYRDEKIKAKGNLQNGQPTGLWEVFYPDGKSAAKRFYHSPIDFETLYPELPKNGPASLFGAYRPMPLERDSNGVVKYRPVHEKDLWWEKWLYKWVPASAQNDALFEDNRIWNVIWRAVKAGKLKAYAPEGQKLLFKQELASNELEAMDFSRCRLLGLQLKEVIFFDKHLMSMESRITGLCPVFLEEARSDTLRPFWVYYPHARPFLAKIKPAKSQLPPLAENLDDVLHFRHFSSVIYTSLSLYQRPIDQSPHEYHARPGQEEASEKLFVEMVEMNFYLWVYFNSAGKK